MFQTAYKFAQRGFIAMLFVLVGACSNRKYVLIINNIAPDKSQTTEKHIIYAGTDSAAYSQATVIFYVALHAYNKMAEESKPYVTRPIDYKLFDSQRRNVDSLLGSTTTSAIKKSRKSLIN